MVKKADRLPVDGWDFKNFETILADLIISLREKASLSQRQLAKRLSVSAGYVGQVETSRTYPNREMALKISKALGDEDLEIVKQAELEEFRAISLDSFLEALSAVIKDVFFLMDDSERSKTFVRIERRIAMFGEDRARLADNVRRFMIGDLGIDEEPSNGLRPLRHYICPITPEIDSWHPKKPGGDEMA